MRPRTTEKDKRTNSKPEGDENKSRQADGKYETDHVSVGSQ